MAKVRLGRLLVEVPVPPTEVVVEGAPVEVEPMVGVWLPARATIQSAIYVCMYM